MIRWLIGTAFCAGAAASASSQSMPMWQTSSRQSQISSASTGADVQSGKSPSPTAQVSDDMTREMSGMSSMAAANSISSEGSGTSRLPANDRMPGVMWQSADWMVMAHGYAWGSWTDQGGPRGAREGFVQSMAMLQAERPLSEAIDLSLRSMLSADPLMGERGYPDLFATGETAHGLALVDRQHPHDLLMEMSGRVNFVIGDDRRMFVYAGLPGEPALGPSASMHRGSARFDPEAPISHHWFDSTHITWGVITAGYSARHVQIEGSAFKGREPDENRYNIETPKLDSWSVRATWNPSAAWSAELSYAYLHSPEVLHPNQDQRRLIASVSYSSHGLDVTAGYSRKQEFPGVVLPAWLLEATLAITDRHAIFGRFENVLNNELFEREEELGLPASLAGNPFRISKLTAGYAYTLPLGRTFAVAVGLAASTYVKSSNLDATYGRDPHSLTVFAKLMLGK